MTQPRPHLLQVLFFDDKLLGFTSTAPVRVLGMIAAAALIEFLRDSKFDGDSATPAQRAQAAVVGSGARVAAGTQRNLAPSVYKPCEPRLCLPVRAAEHEGWTQDVGDADLLGVGASGVQDPRRLFSPCVLARPEMLLDIVVRLLYTSEKVFVRQFISNAQDVCEKLRFEQATSRARSIGGESIPLGVSLKIVETAHTFTIEDTGAGMIHDELLQHLGIVAKSRSLEFLHIASHVMSDIVLQLAVGFYSTLVVADKVQVSTKACDATKGLQDYLWSSDGAGSFTAVEMSDVPCGTVIALHLKGYASRPRLRRRQRKSFRRAPTSLCVREPRAPTHHKQEALWMKSSAVAEEHTALVRYISGNSN